LKNRLEIILSEANSVPVSLSAMSSDALDSFMEVVQSLRSIAEASIEKQELSFSISEGSARCAVEAPIRPMNLMYNKMDQAIQGKSKDKEVTRHLRNIQSHVKKENYNYVFNYSDSEKKNVVELCPILIKSKKIAIKRRPRKQYSFKLKVITGYLNQIGGRNPNYHFNFGLKESITIDCSMKEAMVIKRFLYQDVDSLLLCKEWFKSDKKNEYFHKLILDKDISAQFTAFINKYNEIDELVDKLDLIHDFVDESFTNSKFGHKILENLMIAFNDANFHLSEIKTLLVISKPFINHSEIKGVRLKMLDTYQKKKLNV
jgi:hypothetical protein